MSRVVSGSMCDIKKIFCAYHPSEFLMNFCSDAECLMPLCPNCVVEHTEQHFLANNKPCYLNLNDALQQVRQKCYHNIILYEQLGKNNQKIFDYAEDLRRNLHNQIEENKQLIFRWLDRLFTSFEQKLVTETIEKYQQAGVYNIEQAKAISECISEHIRKLYEKISVLKSDNCLAGLITYYSDDQAHFTTGINDITNYVNKNKEAGKIQLSINYQKLNMSMENFCENIITVESLNQDKEDQVSEQQQNSKTYPINPTLVSTKRQKNRLLPKGKENISIIHNEQVSYRNLMKRGQQIYKAAAKDTITKDMKKQLVKELEQQRSKLTLQTGSRYQLSQVANQAQKQLRGSLH